MTSRRQFAAVGFHSGELEAQHRAGVQTQAYGNCPQYIQRRHITIGKESHDRARTPQYRAQLLRTTDIRLIESADTFFLGTTHPDSGNDASHRGGPAGFVRATPKSLWWPDYPGNNMFNSFGNLAVDPTAALLFVDFYTGNTLQLSGTAAVNWDAPTEGDDGETGRRAQFSIRHVVATQLVGWYAGHEDRAGMPTPPAAAVQSGPAPDPSARSTDVPST